MGIDLAIAVVLSLLMVPLVAFTSGAPRVVLGLAFVLFFPGYTFIAALFPRKGALDGMERLAYSLGLSLVLVPLIGLALNFTPWGIRLYPTLIALLVLIITMSAVAWHRRGRLLPEERFAPWLGFRLSPVVNSWVSLRRWEKAVTLLLILGILGTLSTVGWVMTQAKVGESFTEFYVLGGEGRAQNYPQELIQGEEARVILGIVNREQEAAAYEVVIAIDGERIRGIGPISLSHQEKWEREVYFSPARVGSNQKVEFLLYKGTGPEPYRRLHLWVSVKEVG